MATVPKSSRVLETTLATASAGPFSLGFRVFDTDGFDVYVDGVRQTVSTDYSVSASFTDGYDDAATITFTTTLDIGTEIVVYGKMVADRETDYSDGDANLTLKLNTELARIIAMISEGQRDIKSAVRIIGNDNASLEPAALGLIGFDGSGNLTVLTGAADATVSVAMAPVVAAATLALARAAMGLEIGVDVQAYSAKLAALAAGTIDGVPIGQTSPSTGAFTTLGASGAAVLSSTVQMSGLSLAAGQVLKSDGSGNLSAGRTEVLISTTTISNDATVDIVLDTATYKDFRLRLNGVIPATDDVSLYARTSTDGGSTFDSGASDYKWTVHTVDGTGAYAQNAAANFNFAGNVGSAAGESGIGGNINIINPGAATKTRVIATLSYTDSTGVEELRISGGIRDSAADVDAIRLLFSSGNLESGEIELWGVPV